MIKGIQNGKPVAMEILDRPGIDNCGGISIAMSSPEVSFPYFILKLSHFYCRNLSLDKPFAFAYFLINLCWNHQILLLLKG